MAVGSHMELVTAGPGNGRSIKEECFDLVCDTL